MKNKASILLIFALLLSGGSAFGAYPQTIAQHKIQAIVEKEPISHAEVGVFAVTCDGDTIASYASSRKLTPASNQKLLTTGLAMKLLGPEWRFETKLTYSGTVENGVLKGDLYIIGGGDPTLGTQEKGYAPFTAVFSEWKRMLSDFGITSIEGRIIGDPSWFDGGDYHDDWAPEDTGFDYGAAVSGLNFMDNIHCLALEPGDSVGEKVKIEQLFPILPWMKFRVCAETVSKEGSDKTWMVNSPQMPMATLFGTFPLGYRSKTKFTNNFPAYTCAYFFRNYLVDNGFPVSGNQADVVFGKIREDLFSEGNETVPEILTSIGTFYSPTLKEIASSANFNSNNFYTEALFRALSKNMCGSASIPSSRETLKSSFKTLTKSSDVRIADGCGLSRKNFISPEGMVKYLKKMTDEPVFNDYIESIPTPGHGTLISRFARKDTVFKSRIHMKSGSMEGIRCFSGYILPSEESGKIIVFSVMTGGFTAGPYTTNRVLENIISCLTEEN